MSGGFCLGGFCPGGFCPRTAWNVKVNITKTKVVIFSKTSCKNKGTEFIYANKPVELVESFKYLGVLFKSNGKFHLARKVLFEQASKAMFSVLSKTRTHNLNVDAQLKLFDTLVLPVLLYGCEIWGSENIDLCEKLHLKFCRYVLNVKSSTPSYMIYGELGRFPVMSSLYSKMIGFWANLVCGNSNKISFKLYQIVRGYLPENAWLNKIETILQDVGLSNIWQSESVPSKNWLRCTVDRKLSDQYIQMWSQFKGTSSKATMYFSLKNEIKLESYSKVFTGKIRNSICRFRTANHRLAVEFGRWIGKDYDQRFCTLCRNNKIGDEYHFFTRV